MKTDFFQFVATAEFSKFAGILSAALSQHHISGFAVHQSSKCKMDAGSCPLSLSQASLSLVASPNLKP